MSTDPKAMVKEGIRLYKANQKAEARTLWEQVTELDPYSEQAWLWLSAVVESVEDQRVCLENVLYINPDNPNAKKGLATLDAKNPSSPGAKSSRPAGTTPLGTAPLDASAANRTSTPPIATSSASSSYVPAQTSPEVYDDWIGSLNLSNPEPLEGTSNNAAINSPVNPSKPSSGTTKKPSTSPFTTTDFDSIEDRVVDEINDEGDSFEIFTPLSKEATGASYSGDDLRALMSMSDDDEDHYASSKSSPSTAASAAPAFRNFSLDEDDDDVFGDDFATFTTPAQTTVRSSAARTDEYDLGDDPFSDNPFPNAASVKTNPFSSDALDFDDNAAFGTSSRTAYGAAASDEELDAAEYFAMIPASIKAKTLPGSDEKYPIAIRLLFLLLLLLNMGAVIMLVVQLAS